MELMFGQLPVGETFTFRGAVYRKVALSMASDEREWGNIFLGETVVTVEAAPAALLPWKPDEIPWYARIGPAPGQGMKKGDS